MTASEKVTVTAIVSAALYDPFAVDALTLVTVGAVESITIALFAPSSRAFLRRHREIPLLVYLTARKRHLPWLRRC